MDEEFLVLEIPITIKSLSLTMTIPPLVLMRQ
jgi:hypothetical protein